MLKTSFQLPPNTFSELRFGPAEALEFEALAEAVVRETLDDYEDYLYVNDRKVDRRVWKTVRRKERVCVYKQRQQQREQFQQLRTVGGEFDAIVSKASTPVMLTVGDVVGTLDDAMYGAFADSTEGMRMRTSYLNDAIDDVQVLQKFQGPTPEDPYRFCGLVWYTSEGFHCPFVKRRDISLLMSMGLTTTSRGERIGYYLMHSVDIPQIRPLPELKLVRLKMSLCYLMRQLDDDRIDIFQKGFIAPMGDMPEFALVAGASMSLASAGNTVQASYAKKLAWMFTQARHNKNSYNETDECGGCHTRVGSKIKENGGCMICKKPVCTRCKVQHKITVHVTAHGFKQKYFAFCVACVVRAKQLDAFEIAQQHVTNNDSLWACGSHGPLSTCSSDASASSASSGEEARQSLTTKHRLLLSGHSTRSTSSTHGMKIL
ncbi:TPA: hypothetical protein N0F65_007529 [Lagenidium giganteum]|uniref:Uncharacterized protein n=1 Tax=Lagenidium giganteum TaxID=4803 RepID=A0AAV2ZMU0_9STRA|nr:TPA: hypothetical protein N0F65_007529 [Lagenidium giganteum]